jgi:hypothetical protein
MKGQKMRQVRQFPRIWIFILLLLGIGAILLAISATGIAADTGGNKAKEHIRFAPVEPQHPTTVPQHAPVVPAAQSNVIEVARSNAAESNPPRADDLHPNPFDAPTDPNSISSSRQD